VLVEDCHSLGKTQTTSGKLRFALKVSLAKSFEADFIHKFPTPHEALRQKWARLPVRSFNS